MKRIFSIFLFCLFTSLLFAQNDPQARAIIDKASASLRQNTVHVAFNLLVEDLKAEKTQTLKGDLLMKSNKFKLKVGEVETFFDGKTEWVYVPKNKEVSVSEPDPKELQEINPTLLLSGYSKKAIIQFGKEKSETSYSIDIFPEEKKKPFFKINVVLNKKTQQLISIKMFGRNSMNTTLQVTKYEQGVNIEDTSFVFDVKKHPGVNVNDLR
jgi:outer membrane lipoprotein-sorting protein